MSANAHFFRGPVQTDPIFASYRYDAGGRRVVGRRSVAGLVTAEAAAVGAALDARLWFAGRTAAQQGVGG